MAGRKKLDRKQMQARVANDTPDKLHELLRLWVIYTAMVQLLGHSWTRLQTNGL
jgi:hypothetical protein